VGVSFILLESVLFIAVTSLFVALGLYPFRRKHKTKNKQKAPITLVNSYFIISLFLTLNLRLFMICLTRVRKIRIDSPKILGKEEENILRLLKGLDPQRGCHMLSRVL
jgi:hypothetical protein